MSDPLIDRCDAILADLDGVVYAGPHAIPGAPEALMRAKSQGVPVVYVTNNASRAVEGVAEHLSELGLPAEGTDVASSAQAAGELLRRKLPEGSRVLVTGSQALADCLLAVGLTPVRGQDEQPLAVVQGFDPEIGWNDLAEASYVLADESVLWVATNTDSTIPRERGIAPGNGSLVAAVAEATNRSPVVAGKPEAPIFRTGAQRVHAARPLVVGDRLDTDILGGNRAGFETALVLTGVDTEQTALAAVTGQRPTHLIATLADLFEPAAQIDLEEGETAVMACCGAAVATAERRTVTITGEEDDLDAWRAACAAWWVLHPEVTTAELPQLVWERA